MVIGMSTKNSRKWNAIVKPPSVADHQAHAAYFESNREAPPAAVLVFHGVGEEVRFETLSRAASLLLVEAEGRGATGISVAIRSVPKDAACSALEVRAELEWTEKDGTKRQVHVYEAYWAPLIAGRVTFWETIRFLLAAGWRGMVGAFSFGSPFRFDRWLFGGFKILKINRSTPFLLLPLMAVAAFIAGAVAMALAAVTSVARQFGAAVSVRSGIYNAASFIYGQVVHPWNALVRVVSSMWASMHGFMFDPVLSSKQWGQAVLAFLVWGGSVALALWFRGILAQFAGSLVAYLSPYKCSKWEDLRHQIQQRGLDLASLVYEGHDLPSGWIPEYDRIVVLGHSLGSVIAYDTLNAMINIAAAKLRLGQPNPVVERTRALITFGSPLDKTAYLFRLQLSRISNRPLESEGLLREAMVSAVQPLITDYPAYRFNPIPPPHRPKWINLWSKMDIISGSLDYYDDPAMNAADPRHVQNFIDPQAWIPLAAHNQYWTNKLLRKAAYDELF